MSIKCCRWGRAARAAAAPLVSDRRGEHAQLLGELAAQGFVRVRIDVGGSSWENAPPLDARRKHTIEAVVDRFRARPEAAQRLAESFETALSSARAPRASFCEDAGLAPLVFSSRHACPECGFAVPPLEPRMFPSTSGRRCASCGGLGLQEFFDPQRVVSQPACRWPPARCVAGTGTTNTIPSYWKASARHYGFDIDTPWAELPERLRPAALRERRGRDRMPLRDPRAGSAPSGPARLRASCRIWSAAGARETNRWRGARETRQVPWPSSLPGRGGTSA